jgi:hypothetical protein
VVHLRSVEATGFASADAADPAFDVCVY